MSNRNYKGVFVTFEEQYTQFFKECNWYTFDFCKLEIDNDTFTGSMEVTVIVLGVGVRITYNYTLNDNMKGVLYEADKIRGQNHE